MQWFFIALAAPFLWALVNISDKYLVKKYSVGESGSGGLVLFSSLIGILAAGIISIFISGIFDISILDKILLFSTGVFTVVWVILYLATIEVEDISVVVPWFISIPVFGYILGYIFLGEKLAIIQLIGFGIVFLGLILISIDSFGGKIKQKKKLILNMTIVCLIVAISGIIFKSSTVEGNFWISSFWIYLGLGISGLFIYFFIPKYRAQFIQMNRTGGYKIFFINVLSETLTIAGNLLTNFALLLAPVAIVFLVGSFQPAIVLMFTTFSTKFFPHIVKEDISRKTLIKKFLYIVIIIFGSSILFYYK